MTSVQQYSTLPSNLGNVVPMSSPYSLSRRRNGVSNGGSNGSGNPGGVEAVYKSEPRMKRRNAISYENDDSAAKYIRYLGDALSARTGTMTSITNVRISSLPELPSPYKSVSPSISKRRGRRGSFQQMNPSKCYRDTMKGSALHRFDCEGPTRVILNTLKNIDSWDFDVFATRRITEGRPLFSIGLQLLHQRKNIIPMDLLKTMKFLAMVEEAYHPDNCYHNSTHAADVTQALHCLLREPKLTSHLSPLECTAAILAAICHDLDHPGVNQNFLVKTSSYLATIHGDNSTLERHHCHTAKATIKEAGLLDHLSQNERIEILSLIEELILATDVGRHKEFMSHFEGMIVSPSGIDFSNKETRRFILMIAIKAADISNPARCLSLSKTWSESIMEEFFRQGDNERSMKLPISFLCDRKTTTIPKSQSGFFEFVALPLFKAWSQLFNSPQSVRLCKNIVSNKDYWDSFIPRSPSDSGSEDSS